MHIDIIDTETAGLDGGVCDLAIVTINEDFEIVRSLESLIDPERPISPSAMGIHGITNEMVADKPTLSEFQELHNYPFRKDGLILAGHNVQFDIRMLADVLPQMYAKVCTLKLARNLYPQLENAQLQTIRYTFGLEAGPAHRAMGDVITCLSFMKHICQDKGWGLQQLVNESRRSLTPETKLTFGKHKGTRIKDLPQSYMVWALREMQNLDPDLREAFQASLV
jgi:exodeoxyribonuclease X